VRRLGTQQRGRLGAPYLQLCKPFAAQILDMTIAEAKEACDGVGDGRGARGARARRPERMLHRRDVRRRRRCHYFRAK